MAYAAWRGYGRLCARGNGIQRLDVDGRRQRQLLGQPDNVGHVALADRGTAFVEAGLGPMGRLPGIEGEFSALLDGYASGYAGGLLMRIPVGMRRALTLEVGLQNAGLGTVLAMDLFGNDPKIAIAPAMYTFGCMFTGTILARAWAMSGGERETGRKGIQHGDTEGTETGDN